VLAIHVSSLTGTPFWRQTNILIFGGTLIHTLQTGPKLNISNRNSHNKIDHKSQRTNSENKTMRNPTLAEQKRPKRTCRKTSLLIPLCVSFAMKLTSWGEFWRERLWQAFILPLFLLTLHSQFFYLDIRKRIHHLQELSSSSSTSSSPR
jgi:hypothetical protein